MKRRLSRIIAILLVLIIAVCNQSYSSWASDEDINISEEIEVVSGENEIEQSEIATDSDIEPETSYPAFIRSESVDDVRVTVTASEGVFPEEATLNVNKVTDVEEENINQAVDAVRDDNVMVAHTYTFDIKVLDENGIEIQPADGQTVNVSFAMDEVSNQNLTADVYHVPDEDGSLVAEELNTTESGDIVTAVSDGFSYYTVEFTYDEKQYVMNGDTTVALSDILDYVGLTGEVSAVSVSDESLFSASNESGEWMVTAHQAFSTNEWMKVTIDGVEYEIVVTDATNISSGATYKVDGSTTYSITIPKTSSPNGNCVYNQVYNGVTSLSSYTATSNFTANISADGKLTLSKNDPSWSYDYTLGSGYNAWKVGYNDGTYYFYRAYVKSDQTWTISASNSAYTGSSVTGYTLSGTGYGTLTKTYSGRNSTTYSGTTAPTSAGDYHVVVTYAGNDSYNQRSQEVDFSISPKSITITAKSQTVTYGTSITNGTGQVTASLASGDSLTAITLTPSTSNVTTSGTITPSSATIKNGSTDVTANYTIAYNKGTLTINKASLTVTAKPKTITYGSAPANDGVTYSGFKGSDSASSLNGTLAYSYNYSQYGNVGSYTITPSGLTSSNYNITFATGTLTVNQKVVGLTWTNTSLTYNGSAQKPTATATGTVNSDEIGVTVTGEKTNVGTYTATASALTGTKAGNYKLPSENTYSFSIVNASMNSEVSATDYTGTYDAAAHGITVTAPSGATVKYRTASSGDYNLTANPTFTDAGTYTVYYQVTKPNYAAVTGSATVKINPKELTLNWSTNKTFTYNGSPQAPTATIDGVINNDVCTVSVNGAQTNYSATAYTATAELIGAKAGNYVLPANHITTFTIGKKATTITANNRTVTYGTLIASDVANVTATGLVDGDIVTAITLTPSTSDVTTNGTITPSAATIKKGDTDVTNNYNITYNTGNLTINKKPITISGITASNKTYDGATVATLNYNGINWIACGMVAGDDLSVTAAGTFSDADVGTGKTVTITGLTLGGTKVDNYELASSGQQTSTTADINTKAITITADSDSKVYDGTAHTKNSYSITSGGLATGDSIESVTVTGSQTFVGSSDNEPSTAVIKNSSGVYVTGNYDITYTKGTLTVTKKPLTITADSDTKVYDATPLTKNSYTHTELASGDNITSVTITGSQTSVGESANEPSAAVIKKGDEDVTANYDITYANGTLTVTKKLVTITANSDTKIYDGTALTNDGYTVSGLETGDRVDSVTINGSQTSVGTNANEPSYAVIKNSAEEVVNDNYTISYVNGTLEVTKKAITITADSDTKVYDGTALTKDSYTNTALADGDRIDSVTVTGTQTIAGEGANVPSEAVIKNAANEDVTLSYDITYENGTLEVTQKAVTITADDATKVYDGTALTIDSYTNSDLTAGDTIESVTVTGSQTNAGQSANVPSEAVIKNGAGEDVTASYDITYVNGTLEVTKKPVTIDSISAKDKIYDGTTDAELDYANIDWSACGMVDGDELSVTATGTFDNSDVGTGKNVTITDITLGGTSIDNYILSEDGQQTTAVATINKKAVTVTALKQTVAVNGEIENSVEFAELSGALEGHELAEITLTSSSTEKTTTEGVITPSNAKIVNGDTDVTDNYDITYIDGVMTVTKAEAEVVLDNGDDGAPASVTEVEAPNLQELADEEAEEGRLVKVELSVKPVSESKVSATTVADVKKTVESLFAFVDMESVKVEYLEIDLTKYVDNVKEGAISDTGKPLEIILTYDTSKAGNPVIIRNHEGAVVVFTQLSARPTGNFTDATYYVEGDKIYMYSQYFSDFAIAYSVEKTFNVILDDGNGNIIRQIVSEGTKFIPPTDLTKDGYEFDGWYKDEAFTEKWNPDTDKVTSDIMLYAKWEEHKEETPTTTEVTTETPATTEETTETPTTTEETTETPTTTEVTTEIPVTTEETTEKPTTTETTTETSVTTEATTETSDVPETKVDTPAKVTNPSNDAKSPKTRDTTHTDIAFFLIIFAALGVLCLGFIRRKI